MHEPGGAQRVGLPVVGQFDGSSHVLPAGRRLTSWRSLPHAPAMPDRSRKRPRDLNSLAASLIAEATGQEAPLYSGDAKDSAAVDLGRRGGLVGGRARAEKLSPEQRSEIARKAAAARWAKK